MELYKTLVIVHGLAGVTALLTFWAAAFARKGSPLHRGVGKAYLLAMVGICVTAVPMAIQFYASGRPGIATFLAYLVVVTATAMWLGWRSIRSKRDQASFRGRGYLALALLNLGSSALVFAVGWNMDQVLLMGFSLIGTLGGVQMLARRARPMAAGNWWLQEHYGAMVGCGAATHVAFLSIGLNRLVQLAGFAPPSWYPLLAWALPVGTAFLAAFLLDRKYRPKPRPAIQVGQARA